MARDFGELLQEVIHQQADVLGTINNGEQVDANHAQAVIQVFAENFFTAMSCSGDLLVAAITRTST